MMNDKADLVIIAKELHNRFYKFLKFLGLPDEKLFIGERYFRPDDVEFENIINNIQRDESRERYYYLNEEFEEGIFRIVFELVLSKRSKLFHYTSLNSAFMIVKTGSLQMGSIAGMNDSSELNYIDKLLKKKRFKNIYEQNKIEEYNRRFITSFSRVQDHFNQWRLYGNDTKGVCLEFETRLPQKRQSELFIGNILYGNRLGNLINGLYNDLFTYGITFEFRRLFLWKNFMKHKDYEYEKEVRMMIYERPQKESRLVKDYKINYYNIIVPYLTIKLDDADMPIVLKRIRLGGNCAEQLMNKGQFKYLLENHSLPTMRTVEVELSKIDHYRKS